MTAPHHDDRTETCRVRVTGLVQGVGYRFATVRQAHALGLCGWVANLDDGSVAAEIQGPASQVDRLLEWMRSGPPGARVRDVEVTEADVVRRYRHFEQH
jgi:acylphosphatase